MDKPSPSMRDLAGRLLAASQTASDQHVHDAAVVSEELRIPLTRFAGADGFASLLRRALVLASAEVPSLQSIKVGAEGRLEGFEQVAADTGAAARGSEAAVAITAHLLGLLVTFIGEPLTLRLVRGAWPDTSLDEQLSGNRG
jgi:signal transduction histidine kinase